MPALDTGFRPSPPFSERCSPRFQATPLSANNATSTGIGPYMWLVTPNGRSSGKRNSALATAILLPTKRSNVGQLPLDAEHSPEVKELIPYPRTNSGYP